LICDFSTCFPLRHQLRFHGVQYPAGHPQEGVLRFTVPAFSQAESSSAAM
jgi:hypothetical protein